MEATMVGKKGAHKTLAERFPQLVKEWHPTKNGSIKPDGVSAFSAKKVWWKCSKNPDHEWETVICYRTRGAGCPECLDSGYKGKLMIHEHPELLAELHPTKNTNLKIDKITTGSAVNVWWVCSRGHEWPASVKHRCRGTKCPYCSGRKVGVDNSLLALNPELSRQWHPTRNGLLQPSDIRPGSSRKVWWLCERGHESEAPIYLRNTGVGCYKCYLMNIKSD